MKKSITSLCMVLLTAISFAQQLPGSGDSTFAKNGLGTYDLAAGGETIRGAGIDNAGFIWTATQVGKDIQMNRLQPNGDEDMTFGTNGKMLIDFMGASERIEDLVIMPNGEAVIIGYTDVNGTRDLLVSRIRKDGSVDPDFAENGHLILDISGMNDYGMDVMVDQDDKIVVCGHSTTANTVDYFIVRLTDSGTMDSSFNVDGVSLFDVKGVNNVAYKITQTADGNYIIFGNNQTDFKAMVSATSNNGNGKLLFNGKTYFEYQHKNVQTTVLDGLVDFDGNFVMICGFQGDANYDALTVRFKPSGNMDLGFNSTGYNEFTYTPANLGHEYHTSMYLQDDSMILISGVHDPQGSEASLYTMRLKKDGTKDPFYGNGNGYHYVALDPTYTNLVHTFMLPTDEEDRMLLFGRFTLSGESTSYVYAFNRVQAEPASGGGGGTTGIESTVKGFNVYPNPAYDEIYLDVELNNSAAFVLRNLQGVEVQKGKTNGLLQLDNKLTSGLYFLTLEHNGYIYTAKVLVRK